MTTFGAMKTRIASELRRSDLTSDISAAILSAIKHHEREAYYFNEARDLTFNTVAAQEFYTSSDAAGIATLGKIISVKMTVDAANDVRWLTRANWLEAEESFYGTADTGDAEFYSYFAQTIRLLPIPDAVRSIRVAYQKRFTALSADGDTNAWMTDAEELIRTRAKILLFRDVVYEPARQAQAEQGNAVAKAALDDETRNRERTGRVTPCL